ncbi:MAG TPA: antitoxin Xre/MbcA/ParS toxin-binding domain-containing protein [Acidobacteriaceae bacterium]
MPKPPATNTASYPDTLYGPPDFPNLGAMEDRQRLSPAALRAFLRIMSRWGVRDEDARVLLREVSNGTYYQWKQDGVKLLDQDRLMRVSYLIGIFKALNILFSPALADRWVQLPNSNAIFAGRTPLAYMLRGGTPAMETVRHLLDARRGG